MIINVPFSFNFMDCYSWFSSQIYNRRYFLRRRSYWWCFHQWWFILIRTHSLGWSTFIWIKSSDWINASNGRFNWWWYKRTNVITYEWSWKWSTWLCRIIIPNEWYKSVWISFSSKNITDNNWWTWMVSLNWIFFRCFNCIHFISNFITCRIKKI